MLFSLVRGFLNGCAGNLPNHAHEAKDQDLLVGDQRQRTFYRWITSARMSRRVLTAIAIQSKTP